jgi:hypothetical protein
MAEVMEGHIRDHLGAEDLSAEARRTEVDQIATLLRSYMK